MRIAFLSNEYPPVTDGIGAYVASMCPGLAARGHEVHVISCLEGQARSDTVDRGVHVHRRPFVDVPRGVGRFTGKRPRTTERLRTAVSAARTLRELRLQPDVVEAPDWMAEGLVVALGRTPLVAHLHTPLTLVHEQAELPMGPDQRLADRLERWSVARADVVTSPSRLLADTLRDRGWVRGDVEVVPYPVDLDTWAGLPPVASTAPVALVVGRLERRKAPEVVVDACASIPGAEVVLIGRNGEDRDGLPHDRWLAARAERAGTNVTFAGLVPRDELPQWYGRARVVALASTFDNFPMVGLEALAAGRPVVCSDRTGTAELVAGTDAGRVVPVGDVAAMADALRPYLTDVDAASAAGAAARALAEERCAPEVIAARREAVYRRAIG